MSVGGSKTFDGAVRRVIAVGDRHVDGIGLDQWRGLSQSERLVLRFHVMAPSERAVALELLSVCPGSVGRDDWLAMTHEERIAAMKASAMPPDSCGPAIASAIARGPFAVFQPVEMVPDAKTRDGWKAAPNGYRGRDSLRAVDVFDRMEQSARRAKRLPLLSPSQVSIGRHYRDLTERHDAGGVKLSSIEAGRVGGGAGGRDFMDIRLIEARELDTLHKRIGAGVAMEVRRIRPSRRGVAARGIITDRALVDAVCLGGLTVSEVLRSYGWAGKGEHRAALRDALASALDRMNGLSGGR